MRHITLLKGQCHEIFDFRFFTWISFPQAPFRPFQIFSKVRIDKRSSRCTTSVVDTGGKWKKILNQKSFHYFFWTPLGIRVSIYINVSSSSL